MKCTVISVRELLILCSAFDKDHTAESVYLGIKWRNLWE